MPLPTEDLDKWDSLPTIATELGINVKDLYRWASRSKTDFPQPIRVGRYKLYEKDQVKAWVILWLKVNPRLGSKTPVDNISKYNDKHSGKHSGKHNNKHNTERAIGGGIVSE